MRASFIDHSGRVETDDLDWEAARRAGLSEDERFILTYFADIEGQTIVYLRDLLRTRAALEPEVVAFLSIWNYEEYFHGRALSRLLAECGHPLEDDRIARVRGGSRIGEWIEARGAGVLSALFPEQFPALYMAWGATQELMTLRGYEQLRATTRNPTLRELCARIAKQERRHFAWYFNSARERLAASAMARRLTRAVISRFWTPVGQGVKSPAEVLRLIALLFPGDRGIEVARGVDAQVSTLPGLDGLALVEPVARRAALEMDDAAAASAAAAA